LEKAIMRDLHKHHGAEDVRGRERTRAGVFSPRIDIVETECELILFADLPGVSPAQLEIHYEDGQLTIHGHVTPRPQAALQVAQEYGVGDFHRSFAIGESIDASRIVAELKRGELTLRLPKVQRVQPRRIHVQAG
jgi:HSP20 family protein